MSVLNVCTTSELDTRELLNRRYRNTTISTATTEGQKISNIYRRFYQTNSATTDSYDNYSLYTFSSSSRNSSFEVIFSRLLDALIFTSAIAITAYSYLTGTLAQPFVEAPKSNVLVGYNNTTKRHSSVHSHSNDSNNHHNRHMILVDPIEDSKRKRTQEWAEQQIILPIKSISTEKYHHSHSPITTKKRSCSVLDKKVQPLSRDNMKREKKRTQSLPVNSIVEKEDELLSRMEERLQSLIQQGQDALKSPVGEYN